MKDKNTKEENIKGKNLNISNFKKNIFEIGIKYCGGCNPRYNRVEEVEKIKNKLENHIFEYAKEDKTYDFILVACGCLAACATHNNLKFNIKKFILSSSQDFVDAYDMIFCSLKGLDSLS
ncbi:MAG: hypothetical protein LBT51_09745 [Fusobacteriaceae bacterium]|jgi:4-hydroxybutyrate CoA-transferase|nr:hypothetical protein [Fusobacteriaceae bacterium]